LLAANEELQSINEEYRSTAEELETSKEEQQSLNEELQTINAELKSRFDSVSTAHNDLQNLMAVTEIGTLFLDAALSRVITDFTHRLRYPELRDDIYRVLRSLATVEKEVTAENSEQWLDVHIRPYRTVDDHIEGVVLTFIDVTARREAEKQLLLVTQELSHRVRNILAVVEALAEQTNAGDINTYRTAFSARIHALAEAHSLLLKSAWREADLRQLLAQTVDPYPHERFSVKGPQLLLSPKQTVGIRLIPA
jgi:two-component system, chemotaxis family, CheB/CheR fusion protein